MGCVFDGRRVKACATFSDGSDGLIATHTGYVQKLDKLGWVRVCAADERGSAVVFDGAFKAGEEHALLCAIFAGERIVFRLENELWLVGAEIAVATEA